MRSLNVCECVTECTCVRWCSRVRSCYIWDCLSLFICAGRQCERALINSISLRSVSYTHTNIPTKHTHTHIHSGGRIGGRCSGGQAVVLFDNNRLFLVYIRFIEYCSELIDQLLFIIDHKFVYKLIIFI